MKDPEEIEDKNCEISNKIYLENEAFEELRILDKILSNKFTSKI